MSQDQIISRIKKLLTHADSAKELGSIAEAEVFMKKANQLLLEHNIELHQIPLGVDEDRFAKWVYGESISYKDNQAGDRWQMNLITVLTKFNLCSFTYKSYEKTFRVYGKMDNVDTVVWLFNFISIGFIRISRETYKALPKERKLVVRRGEFLKNFLIGAVSGLHRKFEKQFRDFENQEQLQGLILYNDQALDEYIEKEVPNLKKARQSRTIFTGEGYNAGLEVGEKYSINKPLAATKEVQSKLLTD